MSLRKGIGFCQQSAMKEFLENNAYFVDFFNAYFFDGEKVLKPENCEELDSEMNDSHTHILPLLQPLKHPHNFDSQ